MANEIQIKVPDIGGATDVDVIEVLVKPGDEIEKNTSLITLESEKASMEIPSPQAGKVKSLEVKVGDKVKEGSTILTLISEAPKQTPTISESEMDTKETDSLAKSEEAKEISSTKPPAEQAKKAISEPQVPTFEYGTLPAGPAVRRMARELGVNLAEVKGSGRKSRITKEDLQNYIKTKLREKGETSIFPVVPAIDFSKFGEIEVKPLNKIKRLTAVNVHRSWIAIPHVTQFDEADVTELEAFRQNESQKANKEESKLTLLAFVTKVVSKALRVYPQFNASLDPSGENLIYKHYCNIGIAVETANGLVVPVLRKVDQLSVREIANEMGKLSAKARDKGLMPNEMSGGCFTISSLGGIGGTAFTPIVNSPEVAILGLSRTRIKPLYDKGEFKPRLMLPLSLSYDHRVIDGAEAARFTRFIADALGDIRRILL